MAKTNNTVSKCTKIFKRKPNLKKRILAYYFNQLIFPGICLLKIICANDDASIVLRHLFSCVDIKKYTKAFKTLVFLHIWYTLDICQTVRAMLY
jgi:hypothetical protein